jgi:hypothetical protein
MNGALTADAASCGCCASEQASAGLSGCAGSSLGASGGQASETISSTSESAEILASPATGVERKCGSVLCDGRRAHVPEAHWTFVPSCAECEKCLVSEYAHECQHDHPCSYRLEVL